MATLVGALFLTSLMLAGIPGAQAASTGTHAAAFATVPIPGGLSVLVSSRGPLPAGATFGSPLTASQSFSFNIEINIPTTPAEQAYQAGLLTPGSPNYHQYTPRGFAFVNAWGPTPNTVQALSAYFGSYGLHVTKLDQLGLLYSVSGSVAQVDAALHTTLYQVRSGTTLGFAPASDPALPSSLAPWVGAFHNLNSFTEPHPMFSFAPARTSTALSATNLQDAYNAAGLISGGITGTNVIGLAEMCDPSQASSTYSTDANQFASANGLPADTITLSGSGASSCSTGSSGWGVETDLDIQSSHSIAPGSNQNVCLDNTDPSVCDSSFISSGIEFGSNSWGSSSNGYASIWNTAEASGVDLLASSGDSCAAVNWPAAETYALGVGGTSLTVSGTSWGSETVWSCSGGSGTGGGCDTTDASPPYQAGMTGYPGACASGNRGDPDLGADADPNTGIMVYVGNPANCGGTSPCQVGGTSLACPLWSASLDVIYQKSGFSGFVGGTLYSIAKSSSYNTDFHDITSGSNGYSATVGWDPDTGLGSPNIANLVTGFGPQPLTAALSPAAKTIEAGQVVTFTAALTGGTYPYSFAWEQNGTTIATTSKAIYNYTQFHSAPSPYQISVKVTDSTTPTAFTATAGPAAVTVNPGPSVVFSATPLTVDGGQTIALSATATGGSGGYTYDWTLNGSGFATSSTSSATWTAPNHTFTGTIGVQVYDSVGGSAVGSAPISVFAKPGVLFSAAPLGPIDVLSPVTLTATATGGDPPLTYTFFANGTQVLYTGSQSSFAWTPAGPGSYVLSAGVKDSLLFSASSTTQTIQVNPDPQVTIGLPASGQADVGQYVQLQARTTGGTSCCSFAWTVNGAVVPGASASTYKFKASTAGAITVSVQVVDGVGRSATSPQASLTINPAPTVVIQGSTNVVSGQTDMLTAAVTPGTFPFSYAWTLDGQGVGGTPHAVYNLTSTTIGPHVIRVTATDADGMSVSASETINVTAVPAWYDTPFIPGTSSALVSWGILGVVLVAVIAAAAVASHRRKKARSPLASGHGGAPGQGVPGACTNCGAPPTPGSPFCGHCGAPSGSAPVPTSWAGPPPGYGGGPPGGGYLPPPPP